MFVSLATANLSARRFGQAVPEVEGQGFLSFWTVSIRPANGTLPNGFPINLVREVHRGRPEQRYLDFIYEPILDEAGSVSGIFVEGFDVTETIARKRAAGAE